MRERTDFIGAVVVGAAAVAVASLVSYQSSTLTDVVLFSGGALVGTYGESSLRKSWLACVLPGVLTVIVSRTTSGPQDVGILPLAILFAVSTWAVTTLFFVAGFVAARSTVQGASGRGALVSQLGPPLAIGIGVPLAILGISKGAGGQRVIDGPWPLVGVIASCLVLGAIAQRVGERATALARAVGLAAGVNIGLAFWMSEPEPTNLSPLLLVVLGVATVGAVWAGQKVVAAR